VAQLIALLTVTVRSGVPVVGQVIEDASVRPAKLMEISALTNRTFVKLVNLSSPHVGPPVGPNADITSEDCATGAGGCITLIIRRIAAQSAGSPGWRDRLTELVAKYSGIRRNNCSVVSKN
jgi:hypothetical protein